MLYKTLKQTQLSTNSLVFRNKLKTANNSIIVPEAAEESKGEGVDMYKKRQLKKAAAPNPLSHLHAKKDSKSSQKKKNSKFRRG